ncbi:heavy metal-associated isoprenylated plant protein 3-like [Andrographis paniculata]|uniref:heavy metal-associated isoprenylated plant protein 3-like n=1 Tax=Andrographis paniculata TaxID=175694 RepID=UPI0021E7704E|nr:heavy metal-associated isoprenylated plant protein 3-like [Andrographis paniculata]
MGQKVEAEKKAADGGESKTNVVLKLDLHCEGCAKKVRRAVGQFEGVEKVKADSDSNKLTVIGDVDPTWLREKVEQKTKKKVDLVSPTPKNSGAGAKKPEEKSDKKSSNQAKNKSDDHDKKQPKEPAKIISTAVMKIKLHCDGCADKIKRVITKNIDGITSVTTDLQKDLVTVTGTMNVKNLTSYLQEKLKRTVDTLPPPSTAPVKKGGGGGGEEVAKVEKVSKMEYHSLNPETHYAEVPQMYGSQYYGGVQAYHHPNYVNHGYGNHNYGYEYRPGPPPPYMNINDQMFSDENPNGCSVM